MISINTNQRFLSLPVCAGSTKRLVRFFQDDHLVYEFDSELNWQNPQWWAWVDLTPWQGTPLRVEVEPALSAEEEAALPRGLSDTLREADGFYHEALRPQFHYSARRGWHNDPNGLLFFQETYYLFYQHNPYGCQWGNMQWGLATSRDLIHWEEQPEALFGDALGMMFSGCGVVDWKNTSGLQVGSEPPLVLIYTAAGGYSPWSAGQPSTQCLAYGVKDTSRGYRWEKYAGNPVLESIGPGNRDPKVIWHAPTARWIMALYLGENSDYCLLASTDLKQWQRFFDYTIPDCTECPDIFELAVDGDPGNTRWVLWGSDTSYLIGRFDGYIFTQEDYVSKSHWDGHSYAAQTWSDIPAEDGRRIQINWLRADIPNMPFNQQMGIPLVLTLHTTEEGIRLFSEPVCEVETLHKARYTRQDMVLTSEAAQHLDDLFSTELGDLLDIQAVFTPGGAEMLEISIRGVSMTYDVQKAEIHCQGRTAPLKPVEGKITLRLLVDLASLEIFGNGGRLHLPLTVIYPVGAHGVSISTRGAPVDTPAILDRLEVYPMASIWDGDTQ